MPYSFPNQRRVKIHREPAKSNFLGIKNENWMQASCTLGAHALRLYLYFAANADDYTLYLSPADIESSIGMARSTYHDQFRKLESLGYIVKSGDNYYQFFEKPNFGYTAPPPEEETASAAPSKILVAPPGFTF